MNTQTHRTCIRMSQEEYDLLKEKSRAAGLSANAWLMSTAQHLDLALHCLAHVVERFWQVRKLGYPYAV